MDDSLRQRNASVRRMLLDEKLVAPEELARLGVDDLDEPLESFLKKRGLIGAEDARRIQAKFVLAPPDEGPGGVAPDQQVTLQFGNDDDEIFQVGQERTQLVPEEELRLSSTDTPIAYRNLDSSEFELEPQFSEDGPNPAGDVAVERQRLAEEPTEQDESKVIFEGGADTQRLASSDLNLRFDTRDVPSAPEEDLDATAPEAMLPEIPGLAETLPDDSAQEATVASAHYDEVTRRTAAPLRSATPTTSSGSSSSSSESGQLSTVAAEVSRARRMSAGDVERIQRVVGGARESMVGINLGGYRIDSKIGAGGMGDVYEATQLSLNRKVALKVLPAQLAANGSFIERFYAEARTLATITHNNIVQVYDVGEAAGLHYFTMEKVEGRTFKDLVEDSETIAPEVCSNLLKQTIRGLSRAQKSGIIHRDIKPGNILISEQGDVKVVDFGLAQIVDESGEFHSESVVGTPLYLSPEQAQGKPVTWKTDLYSLGVTFFHLLTGEPPFRGKSAMATAQMHVRDPIPSASDVNTSVPPALSAIVAKMMAKDPDARHATYKDLFDAVEDFELRAGIIKSRTDFLADSLLAIGDHGIRGIWNKIGFMAIVGGALAVLALGIHNVLESNRMQDWIALTGDIGTVLFALAVLFITYVALARKRIVPVFGSIRTWMYAHIVCAIASFLLVSVHSGNYFRWFAKGGARITQYPDRVVGDVVPHVAFLNSFVFLVVIVSGLVGATIWRDVLKQVNLERISKGQQGGVDDSRLTLSVFSQTAFKYWRMMHYPLAIALGLLTVLHVVSILWYRGL